VLMFNKNKIHKHSKSTECVSRVFDDGPGIAL
jgi:hypothetical protein